MKIKNLIVAALIVFSVSDSFAWYTRTTEDGGPNGYKTTSVDKVDGNTTIVCKNPGYSACPTSPRDPGQNVLINYAIASIAAGNLSGSYTDSSGTVDWTSDDTDMTNSNIYIH